MNIHKMVCLKKTHESHLKNLFFPPKKDKASSFLCNLQITEKSFPSDVFTPAIHIFNILAAYKFFQQTYEIYSFG
jgi:hypothetical protein